MKYGLTRLHIGAFPASILNTHADIINVYCAT